MPTPAPFSTPELLAPAGGWDCVRAAVANGADAVYFGLPKFNARLRADNFTEAELPEVVAFCHRHGVKAYVAFNTLVFTGELDAAAKYLRLLSRAGVDALIVQDVGLVRLARAITPELPIHASTQMTITSPEGVTFARELGIERAVLARELSLRELAKFGDRETALPLEVFVHGALCVAYSGQCLTSESLGQRSANRGECAQACRMPYELVVDGAVRDLGDRRYLLSPQDLAAVEEIPALLKLGVVSFKIEGRLKTPEYVAAVCQVYRKAIDAALAEVPNTPDRQQLEMAFSRGLYSGWMHGVNHQELVAARFGKKRGPLVGRIASVGRDFVELTPQIALKLGDGVVFDTGGDTNAEQGGRIFGIKGGRYFFQHGHIDFALLKPGDRVWKTDDPELNKRLRQSFAGKIEPRRRVVVDVRASGRAGETMLLLGSARVPRAGEGVPSSRTFQDVVTGRDAPMTPDASGSASRRDATTNTRDACAPQRLRHPLHDFRKFRIRPRRAEGRPAERRGADVAFALHGVAPAAVRVLRPAQPLQSAADQDRVAFPPDLFQRHHGGRRRERTARKLTDPMPVRSQLRQQRRRRQGHRIPRAIAFRLSPFAFHSATPACRAPVSAPAESRRRPCSRRRGSGAGGFG